MSLLMDFYVDILNMYAHSELSFVIIAFICSVATFRLFWRLAKF